MPDESLLQQYLASSYRVRAPGGEFVMHVGVRSVELEALHLARGASSSAFITAWNPGSKPLPESENRKRNAALRADAESLGLQALDATGHSPGRDWCEESYLILGIDRGQALGLARKYGQVAFLYAAKEGLPELVVTATA